MNVLINPVTINQAKLDFNSTKQALVDMGQDVPLGTPTSEYADKIRNIQGGTVSDKKWVPNSTWWDIETILENETRYPNIPKVIVLLADTEATTTFKGAEICFASDVDGHVNAPTHKWDTTKDKQCNLGYKTRWMIFGFSSESSFKVIMEELKRSLLYFVVDGINIRSGNMEGFKLLHSFKMKNSVFEIGSAKVFKDCISLAYVPPTLIEHVNLQETFSGCVSLLYHEPFLNKSDAHYCDKMYSGCSSLVAIPEYKESLVSNKDMFNGCSSLVSIGEVTNIYRDISFVDTCLNKDTATRVLHALLDNSRGLTANTVTFDHKTLLQLSSEDITAAVHKNWNVVDQYAPIYPPPPAGFEHIPASFRVTATANSTFNLGLKPVIDGYDCTIKWGDNTPDTVVPANGGIITHSYVTAINAVVTITGKKFGSFYMNFGSGAPMINQLTSLGRWEINSTTDLSYSFAGCTRISNPNAVTFNFACIPEVKSLRGYFEGCSMLAGAHAKIFEPCLEVEDFHAVFKGANLANVTAAPLYFVSNTKAKDFSECFADTKLKGNNNNLFVTNTIAENFDYCFKGTTAVPGIGFFKNNILAKTFIGTFEGVTIAGLAADIFRYCTEAVSFKRCFAGNPAGIILTVSPFAYNTKAVDFTEVFAESKIALVQNNTLFMNNVLAESFNGAFAGCINLVNIPIGLFEKNIKATGFRATFQDCPKLIIGKDIFGTDYPNRFKGKDIDLQYCFSRSTCTAAIGLAPEIWQFNYGSVKQMACFGGSGNTMASLSNYVNIPDTWKIM